VIFLLEVPATYSIGFFYNVDSFHGVGEYLVLTASSHLPDINNLPTRQSVLTEYSNLVPVAQFESEKRKQKQKQKRKRVQEEDQPTQADCVTFFKAAW
jgi:hypothetical protein